MTGEARLTVTIDGQRMLAGITSAPRVGALQGLVGGNGGSGYRKRLRPVAADEEDAGSLFRDSVWGPGQTERVVHEYALGAGINPATMRLTGIRAEPHVLPFETCPAAARNVDLLTGEPVRTLRRRVLDLISGTDGCTHLTDALRALAEVPVLLTELARVPAGSNQ